MVVFMEQHRTKGKIMDKTTEALLAELEDMRNAYADFWGAHSSSDIQALGRNPRVVLTPTADRLKRDKGAI